MRIGLPGDPNSGERDQDYAAYMKARGTGHNRLRTKRVVQPEALKPGDVLATGYAVVGEPRIGYNSTILVCITKGLNDVRWIDLPARIPLALIVENEAKDVYDDRGCALPEDLKPGDILANGDEVLEEPIICTDETVLICLTGGNRGHSFEVPEIVPIALLLDEDSAPIEIRDYSRQWHESVGRRK